MIRYQGVSEGGARGGSRKRPAPGWVDAKTGFVKKTRGRIIMVVSGP